MGEVRSIVYSTTISETVHAEQINSQLLPTFGTHSKVMDENFSTTALDKSCFRTGSTVRENVTSIKLEGHV